ncbi:Bug family tripartite tricarboxylate transporter substrate binding protein [Ramlibacter sp. AW1]|uniref:Bug family tripartite tricarboxylate transporter substrate binding protein n=1 Tax=Ramlibacter aurantiacus TaxID=2801330 RepID=A0A937D1S0_9BURK|nr:Bug family tripartite tricarboxylate transporter substrate binding protein [Ramlibacter aurantiacus]MBL0419060.1 Bug family tripartite tricarboxylate transporter substrate binding protein [Ramlibacter aurantiacus]
MPSRRDFLFTSAAVPLMGGLLPIAARAQQMPELARILCGFPPGGTSDAISRRIAEKLRGNYAGNVLVENRPGAGGQIAVTALRDSPANGSVMLLTPSSMLSLYPYVYRSLPYKPMEDVKPVSLTCFFDHAFGVGPAVPESVRTVRDFIDWAKANRDKANYGSPGAGSAPHLIGNVLAKETGVDLRHVAYRGSAPGIQDLLGGQISAMSSPLGDYLPHVRGGRLRILATSGAQPSKLVQGVQTYKQQGFNIDIREWYGVFMPAQASADVIRRANTAIQQALAQPDLAASMAEFGMEVQGSTPERLVELLRRDSEDWGRIVKQIGFTPES